MRWPWNKNPEREDDTMNKEDVLKITVPARQEIQKSQDRLSRIDRILKEAREAEALAKQQR